MYMNDRGPSNAVLRNDWFHTGYWMVHSVALVSRMFFSIRSLSWQNCLWTRYHKPVIISFFFCPYKYMNDRGPSNTVLRNDWFHTAYWMVHSVALLSWMFFSISSLSWQNYLWTWYHKPVIIFFFLPIQVYNLWGLTWNCTLLLWISSKKALTLALCAVGWAWNCMGRCRGWKNRWQAYFVAPVVNSSSPQVSSCGWFEIGWF